MNEIDEDRFGQDLAYLVLLANRLWIMSEQLDQAVYDSGVEDPDSVNNGGTEAQLECLLRRNSVDAVERILRTVDEDGNYDD